MGMKSERPLVIQIPKFKLDEKDGFVNELREVMRKKPKIVVIVTWDKSGEIYQRAKLIGDTEFNLPTQFVLSKNAKGRNSGEPPSPQTIHNIILKVSI